jgi:uncharacterized protein (DUF4415 family)
MEKKRAALSRPEKRVSGSAAFTGPMNKREMAELKKLARMPDSKIDFSDAPDAPSHTRTLVGQFYRPVKQHISLRVDADVLAWFRGRGAKYQTYMNQVLRREMQARPQSN